MPTDLSSRPCPDGTSSDRLAFPSFAFRAERPTGQEEQRPVSLHQFSRSSIGNLDRYLEDFLESQMADDVGHRNHSTAGSTLQSMPTLKIELHDIEQKGHYECAICLETFVVNEPATRIPCDHLFHKTCADTWLKSSNRCPICRYELPTDNASFEVGRHERMAHWKPRLQLNDLMMKGNQELRYLALHLGIDLSNCFKHYEVVSAIAKSGQIELIHTDSIPHKTFGSGSLLRDIASTDLVSGCEQAVTPSPIQNTKSACCKSMSTQSSRWAGLLIKQRDESLSSDAWWM